MRTLHHTLRVNRPLANTLQAISRSSTLKPVATITTTIVRSAQPAPLRQDTSKHRTSPPLTRALSTSSGAAKMPFTVDFYDSSLVPHTSDSHNRTLDDILAFSNNELERNHDFIQVLFPLPERSPINPSAPVLTAETRKEFLSRPQLQNELRRAFVRMLRFYGFETSTRPSPGGTGEEVGTGVTSIRPAQDFATRAPDSWLTHMDHNHLRITRILRCLRVLGLEKEAHELFAALLENDGNGRVSDRTKVFWRRATERPLWMPPTAEDGSDQGAVKWLKE